MEAINQECVIAPGDLREAPISSTTTATNLTGSWKFSRPELAEAPSPCSEACPLSNNIRSIADLLHRGQPEEALRILRRTNPLPAVTGRVCPGFCRQSCNRAELDQSVLVPRMERYLGDLGLERPHPGPHAMRPERAAIIGSGPAGISAAYHLARQGIRVVLYEERSSPGGMLAYGIPEYRLPRAILKAELDNLLAGLPIDLVTERRITPRELEALRQEHDFLVCGPGLWGTSLPGEFAGKPRVRHGLELLEAINSGHVPSESRFVVIGGGNVALDTARCLRRLGKEVSIVYRRTRSQMPAYAEEIRQALDEGVPVLEERLIGAMEERDGGLELRIARAVQTEGGIEPGEPLEHMETDIVVPAVGQTRDAVFPEDPSVLFIGDYRDGAGNVARAMASGRQAAERALASLGLDTETPASSGESENAENRAAPWGICFLQPEEPYKAREADPSERISDFREISPAPDSGEVAALAARCLQCGRCTACGLCWFFCPDLSVQLESGSQSVAIDSGYCKGCGICASVCPRGVIRMREEV
jgi:NADPH-dependent glutamate synthase beta subunit-like oxidoreductase